MNKKLSAFMQEIRQDDSGGSAIAVPAFIVIAGWGLFFLLRGLYLWLSSFYQECWQVIHTFADWVVT